jgi:hypothetical protein
MLHDEHFLLRVGSRHVKRHSFSPLKDSTGWLHAELRHEDSSTFKLEEHPERAHPMYYAPYRDESVDGMCNRLCGIHPTRISRLEI